jgi:hypothetical protein
MKSYCKTLAIAAVVSALSLPALAQSMQASMDPSVTNQAAKMVPANAVLTRTLNADKDQPNSAIKAVLRGKVTLSDGTILPSNTTLIGEITEDDMQQEGTSKLALRFNQAQLKNGKTVPVKVTIIDIAPPGDDAYALNDWTDKTLEIDQVGVATDVDFHSKIASANSGVFVSTKKHNVKVPGGSELQLAIGPASGASTAAS